MHWATWTRPVLALLLFAVPFGSRAASASPPDLTGVWERDIDFRTLGGQPKPAALPYTPAYQSQYDQMVKRYLDGTFDQGGLCTPPGMPQILSGIGQFEILSTPGRLTILYEFQSQIRRIYLNRTQHDPKIDVTMNGDSIAHWEGDTLVIDTAQLKDFSYLNMEGGPHSDQLHVLERLSLSAPDKLTDHVVVEDPVAFTSPWVYEVKYRRVPDGRLIDYECNENPRNPVNPDGSLGFKFEGNGK